MIVHAFLRTAVPVWSIVRHLGKIYTSGGIREVNYNSRRSQKYTCPLKTRLQFVHTDWAKATLLKEINKRLLIPLIVVYSLQQKTAVNTDS